jgi:hypothetical protein
MSQRWFVLVLVLALGVGSLADGATIVWVSDNKTPANGVPADQAWVDLLIAQGYTVDLSFRNKEARTLDATKVAALNAADLIIVSRDTGSGDYDDGTEPTQWNGITAPILLQVAHFARNDRWKWVNTGSTADAQPTLEAVLPAHPIFAGVPLNATNQISILTTNCSTVSTGDVGNGTLIATRADNDRAWIVEWKQGDEFYAGSGQKAGGKRLLFSGGGTAGVSDGTYNYNDSGKTLFLNAVKYLIGIKPSASHPSPANEAADVPRDAVLSWKPGLPSQKHDVYLGTSVDDVGAATITNPLGVLAGTRQDANTFEPADLFEYGKTYYWRIDEVNTTPDATVFKGEIWSFTAEPFAYPLKNVTATASSSQADMGPENTVNGVGLNASDQHSTDGKQMWLSAGVLPNWIQFEFDKLYKLDEMWIWNSNQQVESIVGFGAKDVTVEYSADGSTWTPLAGVPVFTRANGSVDYVHDIVVDFGGVQAKYVRLTINSTWGGLPQVGLSEVRFFYVPLQARKPQPAIDATAQELDVILNWRPGRDAASHEVYLGTDPNAVANGTVPAKTVTDHSSSSGVLNLGTTYYWRVDEVNDAASPSIWTGEVWSFTTKEYVVVDDFDSYTNDSPNRVFQVWIDGYGFSADQFFPQDHSGNGTGATVGYDPLAGDIMEKKIFHDGGKQSMPLAYDNTAAPSYSETTRTFDAPRNWTAGGIKSLSLYFRGAAGNDGQLYVKINNAKVVYNGDTGDIAKATWLPWNIDLPAVGGNLSSVTKLTIGVEGSGTQGIVHIDDIRLYPKSPEYYTPSDPGKTNLLALYACEGNANDTSGHSLNGTVKQAVFVASDRPTGGSAVKVEKAGYLDLGNPASLDFGTGDWAVTAWYKTAMTGTSDAEKGTIAGKGGDGTGGKRYGLIMSESTSGVVTLVTDDDVTKYVTNSKNVTNDDQWHFVVGQRAGTALQIYIDGKLEGTSTIPATYDLSGTSQHNAYIGAMTNHTDGSPYKLFNGLLDEVRLYNRALSMEEILWLAGNTTTTAKPF